MKDMTIALVRPGSSVLRRSGFRAAIEDWWNRRRTRAAIRHLDNHLRRDIGLDPIPTLEATEAALRGIAMAAWR